MGDETRCVAKVGERRSEGKARLESAELLFRGEFRLKLPFREMRTVEARGGVLHVSFPDGTAEFELGPLAEK